MKWKKNEKLFIRKGWYVTLSALCRVLGVSRQLGSDWAASDVFQKLAVIVPLGETTHRIYLPLKLAEFMARDYKACAGVCSTDRARVCVIRFKEKEGVG